jgi:hypothetical protein
VIGSGVNQGSGLFRGHFALIFPGFDHASTDGQNHSMFSTVPDHVRKIFICGRRTRAFEAMFMVSVPSGRML